MDEVLARWQREKEASERADLERRIRQLQGELSEAKFRIHSLESTLTAEREVFSSERASALAERDDWNARASELERMLQVVERGEP